MNLPPDFPAPPQPLPFAVPDSHCHLDIGAQGRDGEPGLPITTALAAAQVAGVDRIVQVAVDVASSEEAVRLAHVHQQVVAAVALHPNEAPRIQSENGDRALEDAWTRIAELAADPRVRAIGETGLDYFRTGATGRVAQEESFRRHIRMAKASGKALVIHDRDAHDDILRVMDDEGAPDVVVMHCFSGDAEFAEQVVDRGWYCSFAGVITFKNAEDLRQALRVVPHHRLLVETDAPFLAPTPHRGKPNAAYLVPLTVRTMAEVLETDLLQLCQRLRSNTFEAFGEF